MEATITSSSSNAWKNIIKDREVNQRGVAWRIGDGKTTWVWGEYWLPIRHQPQVISPCLQAEHDTKVALFIDRKTDYGKTICWTDTSLILKQTLFEKFLYVDSSKLMF